MSIFDITHGKINRFYSIRINCIDIRKEKKMAKMKVEFDRCKGCGLCTTACPKKIVEIQQDKLNKKGYYTAVCVDDEKCIACGFCAMMCPDCAITITVEGGEKK